MKFAVDKKFKQKVRNKFSGYEFEVGILQNRGHRAPLPKERGLKKFHGGPARKTSSRSEGLSVADISAKFSKRHDYLMAPLRKKTPEMKKFITELGRLCIGKSTPEKVEKRLQAVIRNPILKQAYGRNSLLTVLVKGFSRYMIDTGQLFKAIKAKVTRV